MSLGRRELQNERNKQSIQSRDTLHSYGFFGQCRLESMIIRKPRAGSVGGYYDLVFFFSPRWFFRFKKQKVSFLRCDA